ncbi:MAG: hypothetical protein AAFQ52_04575 [Chloroflexota bacterium]
MSLLLRGLAIIWIGTLVMLASAIAYGNANPAPLIEWSSSTLYLRDTRTGVNYQVLRPRQRANDDSTSTSSLPVSGVQIIPSPNGIHSMTIMNGSQGLDIIVSGSAGETIDTVYSDDTFTIVNAIWTTDSSYLLLTRAPTGTDYTLIRQDVGAPDSPHVIGTLRTTAFYVSPDRAWVLSSDWLSDADDEARSVSQVINVFTGERFPFDRRVMNLRWTSDGQYLALHLANGSWHQFVLLNTLTGTRFTSDIRPLHIAWSTDESYLLITGGERLQLYHEGVQTLDATVGDVIVEMMWSPVENTALIFSADRALTVVDAEQAEVRYLTDLPLRVEHTSLAWSLDSAYVTFLERDAVDHMRVLRLDTETGALDPIDTIFERVRQVRYYQDLDNYQRLP